MEFHHFCTIFPEADHATLDDLVNDIKENGLNEPIVLYEGKILDGRNRYLACQRVGVEPSYLEYRGEDPLGYVVSKNMHRRHLSDAQRSYMATVVKEEAEKQGLKVPVSVLLSQFNVDKQMYNDAAKLQKYGIEEVKATIAKGGMSLSTANSLLNKAIKRANLGGKDMSYFTEKELETLREQQRTLLRNIDSEEYDASKITASVFEAQQFRKNLREVQKIMASLEKIPTIFHETVDMVGTLEREKIVLGMLNGLRDVVVDTRKRLNYADTTMNETLSLVARIINRRFRMPEYEPSDEREYLTELQAGYIDACTKCLDDITTVKNRLLSISGGSEDAEDEL